MTRSFFRRRAKSSAGAQREPAEAGARRVILMYHRVADLVRDPFALATPPDRFAEHLDVLQSSTTVVSLDDLLRASADDRRVLVSITFDDGYVDNLDVAAPILAKAGLPATYFVCTGALGDSRGFWWDRVANALGTTTMANARRTLHDAGGFRPLGKLPSDGNTILAIADRLQPLPPVDRDRLVGELEQTFEAAEPPTECAVLDAAGVRALAEQPMTEVGAHTVGHPMLSKLDPAQQLDEIVGGASGLREITGTPPRFFAYPYGSKADYNADSCRAAEQVGFRAAFVNHGAPFDPGRRPYLVPRWAVPTGLTADDFRTWFDAIPTA